MIEGATPVKRNGKVSYWIFFSDSELNMKTSDFHCNYNKNKTMKICK